MQRAASTAASAAASTAASLAVASTAASTATSTAVSSAASQRHNRPEPHSRIRWSRRRCFGFYFQRGCMATRSRDGRRPALATRQHQSGAMACACVLCLLDLTRADSKRRSLAHAAQVSRRRGKARVGRPVARDSCPRLPTRPGHHGLEELRLRRATVAGWLPLHPLGCVLLPEGLLLWRRLERLDLPWCSRAVPFLLHTCQR